MPLEEYFLIAFCIVVFSIIINVYGRISGNTDYGVKIHITIIALLFNLQLLCFLDRKRIKSFFGKIKQDFLNYFNGNWLRKKYLVCLWNYFDILSNNNSIKKFKFTNNLTENINKFLNKHLKRGKYSANMFRDIILTDIAQ